jgi:hypothetical protein
MLVAPSSLSNLHLRKRSLIKCAVTAKQTLAAGWLRHRELLTVTEAPLTV